MRLLMTAMGMSVQRDPQDRRRNGPPKPNPALFVGLGFLFILFMMMRTPGMSHAMLDFVQVLRMGAVALMMISGTMIFAKLCMGGEEPSPMIASPPISEPIHPIAYGHDGRRYAMVALDNNALTATPGPTVSVEHSDPQEDALPDETTPPASRSPTPEVTESPESPEGIGAKSKEE